MGLNICVYFEEQYGGKKYKKKYIYDKVIIILIDGI